MVIGMRFAAALASRALADAPRIPEHLDPKSRQNNSPKPRETARKAIILHTFGVQAADVFINMISS